MFKKTATYNNHTDLQEYTETVTAYIKNCIADGTVTKTITTRSNQKLWMTAEILGLLKTRDEAFRSGDKAALKTARANRSCGKPFRPSLTTSPRHRPVMTTHDALNHFYSRLEMQNDTTAQKPPTPPTSRRSVCLQPT